MPRRPLLATAGTALATSLALVGHAHAGIEGPCTASASIRYEDTVIEPGVAPEGTVHVVPRSGIVDWQATIEGVGGQRTASGSLRVDLPPLLPDLVLESWDGVTERTSNGGAERYELGPWVPSGVTLRMLADHREDLATCRGEVLLAAEGGPFSSPVGPVAIVVTALVAGAFLTVVRSMFARGA